MDYPDWGVEGRVWADADFSALPPPPAFLSWFRNGLLASGIGVISFMQSDMGREAAYGECRPPAPRKLDSVLPHPVTPPIVNEPLLLPALEVRPSFVSVLLLPTSSLPHGHRTHQMGWLRAGLWVRALSNLTSQQRCGSLSQPLMLPPLPSYLCSQTGLPAPSPSHPF